jgi:AcrR family transcriptional regulator
MSATDLTRRKREAAASPRRRKAASEEAGGDTRGLILEVAERLFGEQGFSTVSVRDLTAAAGVNIAAINYYFGSKDKLLFEVFRRRVNELNAERLALLADAEARSGGRPSVREILHALVAPVLRWRDPASGKLDAVRFLVRARTEGTPQIKRAIDTKIAHLEAFRDALRRAMPDLSFADVCWRLHFTLSTMHQMGIELDRLANLSEGACAVDDTDALIDRLVDYVSAGVSQRG